MATVSLFPSNLKSIRIELGQSIRVFGMTLKRAIEPKAKHGYSHAYVLELEAGKRRITPELERAYGRLAAALDETDPDIATSRVSQTYTAHDLNGCYVAGRPIACARPGCRVRFVPTNPAQKYHSAWCRQQNSKGK